MIFNLIFLITASTYWYITGHAIPAFIGSIFLFIYMLDDELYLIAYMVGIVAILSIIFFFTDSSSIGEGDKAFGFGIGIIYMLVILVKAKKIFDNDTMTLD